MHRIAPAFVPAHTHSGYIRHATVPSPSLETALHTPRHEARFVFRPAANSHSPMKPMHRTLLRANYTRGCPLCSCCLTAHFCKYGTRTRGLLDDTATPGTDTNINRVHKQDHHMRMPVQAHAPAWWPAPTAPHPTAHHTSERLYAQVSHAQPFRRKGREHISAPPHFLLHRATPIPYCCLLTRLQLPPLPVLGPHAVPRALDPGAVLTHTHRHCGCTYTHLHTGEGEPQREEP